MFRKIETTAFDVVALYTCIGFVTYVVGKLAYECGKDVGKKEEKTKRKRHKGIPLYYDFYEEEKESY